MRLTGLLLIIAGALPSRAEESPPPLPPLVESPRQIVLEDKGNRVRWGLSAEGGSTIAWGGLMLRGEVRLGYQFSRLFNLYGIVGGGGSLANVWGVQLDLGAVAEFTPVDWFFFGGGLVASY